MKTYFLELVDLIKSHMEPNESFTVWFLGECLDFARFNQNKVRQIGTVNQHYLDLNLINGQKHAKADIGLSGALTQDREILRSTIKRLRSQLIHSNDDPFLLINQNNSSTEAVIKGMGFDSREIILELLKECTGLDLVGCYYGGPIYNGFANSFGQINWFEKSSFVVDISLYHSRDKAVKQSYADVRFDRDVFANKMADGRRSLELFKSDTKVISPGQYRVFFAPAAVYELVGLLNFGGFSRKAIEVKNSPLMHLYSEQKQLSSLFSLQENIKEGVGPNFQYQGFIKKPVLPIIERGRFSSTLISPKTAKEYGLDHNGADDDESMSAIDMMAGSLLTKDILQALGDGLYINNLWYLNYSDRQNGCLTGMTRYLCYVVKNGEPTASFSVMRFDDSVFRIFGENLEQVTAEREMIIDTGTYERRSTSCAILPGIIADKVRFTL